MAKHRCSFKHKDKKKESQKRKKSSTSDSDQTSTPLKHQRRGHESKSPIDSVCVSDLIGEANSVLYEADSETSVLEPSTMASGGEPVNKMDELCSTIQSVLSTVCDIKKSQDVMQTMFEKKLDDIREEMVSKIDSRIRLLQDEITTNIGREKERIDHVIETMQSVQTRLTTLEERGDSTGPSRPTEERSMEDYLNDPDVCITASGIPKTNGEDLMKKANDLICALGDNVSSRVLITGVTRLRNNFNDRPPLIKVSFRNTNEKALVLRNKMKLKDIDPYKQVYVKSSKSHAERLIELNARALLRHLPQNEGRNLRVDANGRIREEQNRRSAQQNTRLR